MNQRNDTLARIRKTAIVPVVRAPSTEIAMQAVEAILAGGIDIIEITMTVPGAIRVIESIAGKFGDAVLVGAGTVLDAETARACMLAGAKFIVSPALDFPTITCCRTHGVPIMAGALTPSEVLAASRAGSDMVKVFPCNSVGGAGYIRSLKAPMPQIELVPTGGVTAATVADFIHAGASAVGAGADLVDVKAIANGDIQKVTDNARRYLEAVRTARSSS